MASIFDRYGIKEVADVVFLELGVDETTGEKTETPVLFLDTLKISTIETTAEQTEARGGKGNAPLIIWDYGKEITVTLQDAVYSPASMAMMFGDNHVNCKRQIQDSDTFKYITRYKNVTAASRKVGTATQIGYKKNDEIDVEHGFVGSNKVLKKGHVTAVYDENGKLLEDTEVMEKDHKYIVQYQVEVSGASKIEVNAATFPGTYKIVGDTYARDAETGKDEFFQFTIYKAKMSSENTITLEAEGDPSVFDMNLRVMRPEDGTMMGLVQYTMSADKGTDEEGEFLEEAAFTTTKPSSLRTGSL